MEAAHRFGIPMFGTLAHSFISAHDHEEQSFTDFARVFPRDVVILLDTYDTLAAVDKIVTAGLRPSGVRLDSGDLVSLSNQVRRRLDQHGLTHTKIIVSSDLDEHVITALLAASAPIDVFGVGTALATSKDAPALGGVYKLVEFDGKPRAKLSAGEEKISYPGCKQVLRSTESGIYTGDVIALEQEESPGAEPLLKPVMSSGRRIKANVSLAAIRARSLEHTAKLPADVRRLRHPAAYPLSISSSLMRLLDDVRQRIRGAGLRVA